MNIPYVPEDLLEVGDYQVVSNNNNILVIDDWYKNFDELHQVVTNIPVPRWKWKEGSRNFVDYYDCRPSLNINFPNNDKIGSFFNHIGDLVQNHLQEQEPFQFVGNLLDFNFYKNIKQGVPNTMQHHPHTDFKFNCVVYIDKVASGGTALYEKIDGLPNNEDENLLIDISKYEKTIIPAKPNRLVIFPGHIFHGGYIEDHDKYLEDWRINQVFFLSPPQNNT
jgi:hypothetical protein